MGRDWKAAGSGSRSRWAAPRPGSSRRWRPREAAWSPAIRAPGKPACDGFVGKRDRCDCARGEWLKGDSPGTSNVVGARSFRCENDGNSSLESEGLFPERTKLIFAVGPYRMYGYPACLRQRTPTAHSFLVRPLRQVDSAPVEPTRNRSRESRLPFSVPRRCLACRYSAMLKTSRSNPRSILEWERSQIHAPAVA